MKGDAWREETREEREAYERWLRTRKRKPHQWGKRKVLNWPVCSHCGLLWMKNELTRKAIKEGCWQ